jgi:hypothetical protein
VPVPSLDVTVHVDLSMPVEEPGELLVSLAVAEHLPAEESLTATGGDDPVDLHVVGTAHGTRLHLLEAPRGDLAVSYDATVHLPADPVQVVSAADRYTYLLPSRFCPSDLVGGFAAAELGGDDDADTARRVMA